MFDINKEIINKIVFNSIKCNPDYYGHRFLENVYISDEQFNNYSHNMKFLIKHFRFDNLVNHLNTSYFRPVSVSVNSESYGKYTEEDIKIALLLVYDSEYYRIFKDKIKPVHDALINLKWFVCLDYKALEKSIPPSVLCKNNFNTEDTEDAISILYHLYFSPVFIPNLKALKDSLSINRRLTIMKDIHGVGMDQILINFIDDMFIIKDNKRSSRRPKDSQFNRNPYTLFKKNVMQEKTFERIKHVYMNKINGESKNRVLALCIELSDVFYHPEIFMISLDDIDVKEYAENILIDEHYKVLDNNYNHNSVRSHYTYLLEFSIVTLCSSHSTFLYDIVSSSIDVMFITHLLAILCISVNSKTNTVNVKKSDSKIATFIRETIENNDDFMKYIVSNLDLYLKNDNAMKNRINNLFYLENNGAESIKTGRDMSNESNYVSENYDCLKENIPYILEYGFDLLKLVQIYNVTNNIIKKDKGSISEPLLRKWKKLKITRGSF